MDRSGREFAHAVQMSKHIVYILRSRSDPARPYIGVTHGVGARLADHNAGRCPHTARHRPWHVHVSIQLPDEDRAIAFERYLKSGSGRAFAKRHFG
jgi:predicted GIY-YIG superfamily endonuclease